MTKKIFLSFGKLNLAKFIQLTKKIIESNLSELCLTKFPNSKNAEIHFTNVQHYNRIMKTKQKSQRPDMIWCEICCCELNNQNMLDIHKQSPKHLQKEQAYQEIMMLKEEYLQSLQN